MSAPINRFRTVSQNQVSTSYQNIYTGPENNTAIVLMTQVSNTTSDLLTFSMKLVDSLGQDRATLVEDYQIPGNDAANVLTGKLVVEEREELLIKASDAGVSITLSVLESRNA